MTFRFIEQHRTRWPVRALCAALQVSPAGYYAWRGRPPSPHQPRRDTLRGEIGAMHARAKARYGSPRVHAELVGRGRRCCAGTVAKIVPEAGIAAKTARTFRHTTDPGHDRPVAPNVLDRRFGAAGPNAAWAADVTPVPTREGRLYLAVVEDRYARRVVGWPMGGRTTSRLVVDALAMAVQRRLPGAELLAHSDRGSQYASEHYQRRLGAPGILCSMSRRANCWDHAPTESFFDSLRKELVRPEDYAPRVGEGQHLRVHRGILQPRAPALDPGLPVAG